MPNIKPISDLRNYSEVLRDVTVGSPVFLTKNGRGRYAILDMKDYEKVKATIELLNALEKGKKSGEEKGWVLSDDVRTRQRQRDCSTNYLVPQPLCSALHMQNAD